MFNKHIIDMIQTHYLADQSISNWVFNINNACLNVFLKYKIFSCCDTRDKKIQHKMNTGKTFFIFFLILWVIIYLIVVRHI